MTREDRAPNFSTMMSTGLETSAKYDGEAIRKPELAPNNKSQKSLHVNGGVCSSTETDSPRSLSVTAKAPRVFYDLPDEVILNIIYKGCEDIPHHTVTRRRRWKPIVHAASHVSSRWRAIIKSAPAKYSQSFWIAHLVLFVPASHDARYGRHIRFRFVQSLAKFRHQLSTSRGCDLTISFEVQANADVLQNEPNPETSYAFMVLRMLVHTMDFLLPYHGQVTVLRLKSTQPQIYSHLFGIIATRWTAAVRLAEISFYGSSTDNIDLTHSSPILDSILRTEMFPLQPVFSANLSNLDTLAVPGCRFLNGTIRVPSTLHHLKIMRIDRDTVPSLHSFLAERPILCAHLMSVEIGMEGHPSYLWESPSELLSASLVPSRMTLSLLHTLTLRAGIGAEFFRFFSCAEFPSLVTLTVSLDIPDDTWESSRDGSDREIEASPLSTDFMRTPLLQRLSITTRCLRLLPFLNLFSGPPVASTSINFQKGSSLSEPQDILKHLDPSTSPHGSSIFRTRHLNLDEYPYLYAGHILRSTIDAGNLQNLKISFVPQVPIASDLTAAVSLNQSLSIPALTTLSLAGSLDQGIRFLVHLDASHLEQFDLILKDARRGNDEQDALLPTSDVHDFPSVRFVSIKCGLSRSLSSINATLWQLLSNVKKISINVDDRLSDKKPAMAPELQSFDEHKKSIVTLGKVLVQLLGSVTEVPVSSSQSPLISVTAGFHFDLRRIRGQYRSIEEKLKESIGQEVWKLLEGQVLPLGLNQPLRVSWQRRSILAAPVIYFELDFDAHFDSESAIQLKWIQSVPAES